MLHACAKAYDESSSPSEVVTAMALVVVGATALSESSKELLNGLHRFACFLNTLDSNNHDKMRDALVDAFLRYPNHPSATNTFVFDYLEYRTKSDLLNPLSLIVYAHDVTCGIQLSMSPIRCSLDTILDYSEKNQSTCIVGTECCFMQSILMECADDVDPCRLASTLMTMYNKTVDACAVANEMVHKVCFFFTHPLVIKSVYFHKVIKNRIVDDIKTSLLMCIEQGNDLNVQTRRLVQLDWLVDVLTDYTKVGPYETHMTFLLLGPVLERVPYLPLVRLFLSSTPRYPFPSKTWSIMQAYVGLKDDGLFLGESKRVVQQFLDSHRSIVSDAKGQSIALEKMLPGDWFCQRMDHERTLTTHDKGCQAQTT